MRTGCVALLGVMLGGQAWAQRPPTGVRLIRAPWRQQVVAEIPTGNADDALGVHAGRDEERARGPSAIIAMPKGEVLIVDGEKDRAVVLSNKRIVRRSKLPIARTVSDAAHVGDGRVVLYDAKDAQLWMVDDRGGVERLLANRLKRFKGLRRIASGRVVVEEQDGSYEIDKRTLPRRARSLVRPLTHVAPPPPPPQRLKLTRMAHRRTATRSGSTEVVMKRGAASLRNFVGARSQPQKEIEISPPAPGKLASVTHLSTDKKKRTFVRIEVVSMKDGALAVRRFVRVFDADLKPLRTFELPVDDVLIPDKDIDIDEDGNVFVMLPYIDRVKVLKYAAP